MPAFFDEFDWFLAYGNADQSFFRNHWRLYNAVTVPGTMATYFRQGTGGFVIALNKPYIIDPRTSIFQAEFDRSRRHRQLAEMHGPRASAIMTTRPFRQADLQQDLLEEMAAYVAEFQRTYAQTSADKLEEYLNLLGQEPERPSAPTFVLPPYFRFNEVHDPWYSASVFMATTALEYSNGLPVCPVICLSLRCLQARDFDTIADSYDHDGFGGYFIWVSSLNQYRNSSDDLRAFAELIASFHTKGRPVINLFGGYYAAMLSHLGLGGISHGVGYGEARDAFYYRGGPPGERYYVPLLHRFYPLKEALLLLRRLRFPELRCECPACARVSREDDPAASQASQLDREGLLSHFLYSRRQELDHVADTPLRDLIAELRSTYNRIADGYEPDIVTRVDHLANWVQALSGLEA